MSVMYRNAWRKRCMFPLVMVSQLSAISDESLMLYRNACQKHIAMMPSYLVHNSCCSRVSEEFLMVYRNARHKQLSLGCWADMPAHTAHAVHSVLQAPQLAQPGWLHLNSGCHCHHDPAHSAGPISSRYASGLLSDPLSTCCVTCCCVTCCCCGTFCCCVTCCCCGTCCCCVTCCCCGTCCCVTCCCVTCCYCGTCCCCQGRNLLL